MVREDVGQRGRVQPHGHREKRRGRPSGNIAACCSGRGRVQWARADAANWRRSRRAGPAVLLRRVARARGAVAVARAQRVVHEAGRDVGPGNGAGVGDDQHDRGGAARGVEVVDHELVEPGLQRRRGADGVVPLVACRARIGCVSNASEGMRMLSGNGPLDKTRGADETTGTQSQARQAGYPGSSGVAAPAKRKACSASMPGMQTLAFVV